MSTGLPIQLARWVRIHESAQFEKLIVFQKNVSQSKKNCTVRSRPYLLTSRCGVRIEVHGAVPEASGDLIPENSRSYLVFSVFGSCIATYACTFDPRVFEGHHLHACVTKSPKDPLVPLCEFHKEQNKPIGTHQNEGAGMYHLSHQNEFDFLKKIVHELPTPTYL
jgi:hypothetical protein